MLMESLTFLLPFLFGALKMYLKKKKNVSGEREIERSEYKFCSGITIQFFEHFLNYISKLTL